MKAFYLYIFFICYSIVTYGQCQLVVEMDTTKSSGITSIGKLEYNDAGFPIKKIYYDTLSGVQIAYDNFYYSNNKLDSIINFTITNNKTGYFSRNEWNGDNLTAQIRHYKLGSSTKKDTTKLTYSSNLLTAIDDPNLKLSSIVFTNGNITSASIFVSQFNIFADATFQYDNNENPFKKLGTSDDIFAYLNKNNLLKIFPSLSPTLLAVNNIYTYNNNNLIKTASRNELIQNTTAISNYGYACINITNIEDSDASRSVTEAYPNPSSNGVFMVDASANFELSVKSSSGRLVYFEPASNFTGFREINLSNHPKGIYLLVLKSGETIKTQKLVFQ